ncbi:LacI family DNA-binding transcriptional regulator [Oceaniglobus ichthyenteri]|uniref:LacI family DNA-binding transcriptional regulator n=1 Tax=Oceaniglobus ichthyenteri TaxID=2136177 RepID=UPI000D3C69FD|nr:LacI family DNA-binding transcriptional regulator [Oceaniglobus ichthyenteri]
MPQRHSIPTLHDVAQMAGVSTATVSRCLNFPTQVAKPTRERVMAAVAELGYSPNFGAKAMASRRTNTIGAIIPTMENAIFARALQAFQEELRGHGYTMLVASTSYRQDIEEEQIRSLVARGADALLLIGHARAPEIYQFLETQGVPALVTWAYEPALKQPSVGFDNVAAMQKMADAVIDLGHKRLALISADTSTNDRASGRLTGIRNALKSAGLDPKDLQMVTTTYGIEQGAVAFATLMQSTPRPTAVFCGNDVLAVGALRRAHEMGIKVPADVSITGFDDMQLAQITIPALTSVHVPHREMGRQSALALVGLLKDDKPLKSIELGTSLVMRDTLAPPPHTLEPATGLRAI